MKLIKSQKIAIVVLGSLLILSLVGILFNQWPTEKEEAFIPVAISPEFLFEMLEEGDLEEVNLVYESQLVFVTLTADALVEPKHQTKLNYANWTAGSRLPHYQMPISDSPEFHEYFATMLNRTPGSESVRYYLGANPLNSPAPLFSSSDGIAWIPLLFITGRFLWSALVYVIIPLLALYLLVLAIRRLRKPIRSEPVTYSQNGNVPGPIKETLRNFPLKLGDRIEFTPVEEIACFFAQDNHVYLYNIRGKEHLVEYTLAELEAKLPPQFVRVHRSYMVNTYLIREIKKQPGSRFRIRLRDEQQKEVVSGQSYAAPVKQLFEI